VGGATSAVPIKRSGSDYDLEWLTTGAVGRSLLGLATITAGSLLLGNGAGAPTELATTSYGRSLLGLADAAAGRSLLGLGASDSPTFAGLTTTGADGIVSARVRGVTGILRFIGFLNAANGAYIDSIDPTELTPLPIKISGSKVQLANAGTEYLTVQGGVVTIAGVLNAANYGANIRIKRDGTDTYDWGLFASGSVLYIREWSGETGTGSISLGAIVGVTPTTASTSTTTGALVVSGGLGIGGRVSANDVWSAADLTASTGAVYIGNENSSGSWRIFRSGSDLVFQRHDGSSYVTKQTIAG
jgi:hypothetical protein